MPKKWKPRTSKRRTPRRRALRRRTVKLRTPDDGPPVADMQGDWFSKGAGSNGPPEAHEDWPNWDQTIETILVFVIGMILGIVFGKTWF